MVKEILTQLNYSNIYGKDILSYYNDNKRYYPSIVIRKRKDEIYLTTDTPGLLGLEFLNRISKVAEQMGYNIEEENRGSIILK